MKGTIVIEVVDASNQVEQNLVSILCRRDVGPVIRRDTQLHLGTR
jgi:hypothetical protein